MFVPNYVKKLLHLHACKYNIYCKAKCRSMTSPQTCRSTEVFIFLYLTNYWLHLRQTLVLADTALYIICCGYWVHFGNLTWYVHTQQLCCNWVVNCAWVPVYQNYPGLWMPAFLLTLYFVSHFQVLIVGGGDGGAAREVLKHDVDEVTMCEIDEVEWTKISL